MEQVRYEVDGAVARVTIDRPERHNAMSFQVMQGLAEAFETARADDDVRVLVVTGAGERAFCAANLRLRGLAVVAVGIALNGAVITVNHGMPIRAPKAAVAATTKHHAERPSDKLTPLGDIILVPALRQSLSFGDLIMLVGLVDVLFHCSRNPATRRRVATARAASADAVPRAA